MSRVLLVDPNNFDYIYNNAGMFGDTNYNMSVPPEDLCIYVELTTKTKTRSVLISDANTNIGINTGGGNNNNVSFIKGKSDLTTGGQPFLTTSFTDISTQLEPIEEALGITDISIEFNSSYAPMININFVDVRGASIFQSGAKSIYNVLFRLPYPLFKLKIKGFYGQPVVYCLHLVKCNTKFNSQNGNFEIATQFVGYTYALLSDMLIGYIKAAGRTTKGAKLLQEKGTISINDFMRKADNIDDLIKKQLENTSDEDRNDLARVLELKQSLAEIEATVDALYAKLRTNYPLSYDSKNNYIVATPPFQGEIEDNKNFNDVTAWIGEQSPLVEAYNEKVGNLTEAKFQERRIHTLGFVDNQLYGPNSGLSNEDLVYELKLIYYELGPESNEVLQKIIDRFRDSNPSPPSNPTENYINYIDASWYVDEINRCREVLRVAEEDLRLKQAQKLAQSISSDLGFQPNIRNVVKMFTAHIEVFLQLLFDVSAKYKDANRLKQFTNKFSVGQDLDRLDITDKDLQDGVIYPWPEYIKGGQEEYLGKPGILQNPLDVPEIAFVEELYEAMVKNIKELEQAQQTANAPVAWKSIAPLDSVFQAEDKPYDRLPDSANHDDLAIWVSLRACGHLWFNQYLTTEEVESIAAAEGNAILSKYGSSNVIKAFAKKYSGITDYLGIQYRISETTTDTVELFTDSNDIITLKGGFQSSYPNTFFPLGVIRTVIPLVNNILESDYRNLYGGEEDLSNGFLLSTRVGYPEFKDSNGNLNWDNTSYYISIYDNATYERDIVTPTEDYNDTIFNYLGLAQEINNSDKIAEAAGFKLFSGKYGVQEFKKINYDDSIYVGTGTNVTYDYFSLFYDDVRPFVGGRVTLPPGTPVPAVPGGLGVPLPDIPTVLGLTTSLANGKSTTIDSISISNKADTDEVPFFIGFNRNNDFFPETNDAYQSWYLNFLNDISLTNKDLGQNVYNFRLKDRLEELTIPYLTYMLNDSSHSLFGSILYYSQTNEEAKALLFLHCFPWRGITNDSNGIFNSFAIRNTFYLRNGFIQVPDLWPVFIGGLLYRFQEGTNNGGTDIINFSEITSTTVTTNAIPSIGHYLKRVSTTAPHSAAPFSLYSEISGKKSEYVPIENQLIRLTPPIRERFIKRFKVFVTDEWPEIKKTFELSPDGTTPFDRDTFVTAWNNLGVNPPIGKTLVSQIPNYAASGLDFYFNQTLGTIKAQIATTNGASLTDEYTMITLNPVINDKTNSGDINELIISEDNYVFFLEHKKDSLVEKKLKELYFKYTWIENDAPKSFIIPETVTGAEGLLQVNKETLSAYYNSLLKPIEDKIKSESQLVFSNNENYQIKLEIYRTCKKIYDKWIGGTPGGTGSTSNYNDIIFQCCTVKPDGNPDKLPTSEALKVHRGDTGELKMIDSFRFVTRSFKDIGDEFQTNPVFINKILYESSDVSFYDVLSRILTENNFDFIPLPNFINYKNEEDLKNVFRPYPCYSTSQIPETGPAFVCVYVGQTSTKLDFDKDKQNPYEYPNDGFDIRDDILGLPPDFIETKNEWEDYASSFIIRYGQQNQNIFKDIRLDQTEFNETAESLQITDAISNRLNTTSGTYVGQNLYNVYSVRSYKVEVEMLGDAMIQPMMYFQLNNIPMFHGAYLITKVRHAIKPNHMSTTFTGTRIKYATTPIVDINELYSSLLEGSVIAPSGGGSIRSGSYPPIVSTIIANGGTNAHLTKSFGQITLEPIGEIDGVRNYKLDIEGTDTTSESFIEQYADRLIAEAIPPLKAMLTAFVTDAKANTSTYSSFKEGDKTYYIAITSMYRNEAKQKTLAGDGAAAAGSSPHGWGIAVDLQFLDTKGDLIPNDNLWKKGFDTTYNPTLKWLIDNSYKYGYYLPAGLRDGGGAFEEYWHFEYHGTAAPYCWQDNPRVYLNTWSATSLTQDASVSNPKNPDGTVASYTSCKYISIKGGDGVDSSKSTKGLNAQAKANEKIVLDYFKSIGLSREQTAGIMGNIYTESRFDANPEKFYDTNGKYSYGLIQWNSGSYDTSVIDGKDAAFQVRKITDGFTGGWNEFLSASNSTSGLDADYAAYLFAYYIERCACCRRGGKTVEQQRAEYVAGCTVKGKFYTPVKRSQFANDYYLRFNDPNDALYWGSVIQIGTPVTPASTSTSSTALESIIIGDSLAPCLAQNVAALNGKSKLISQSGGSSSLWQSGINSTWLYNAVKNYPVNNTVTSVVVSIGSNEGFIVSSSITKLLNELRRVFPNAAGKYYFVKGSYGWGNNRNVTTSDIDTYYNIVRQAGGTILTNGAGYSATDSEAHKCSKYAPIGSEIVSLIP